MWKQGIARGAWLVTVAPVTLSAGALATGLAGDVVRAGDERASAGTALASRSVAAERRPGRGSAARVACHAPETLRLRRFEDGSAQVLCGRRVIVRISVPG
jgi:hypothetical protein